MENLQLFNESNDHKYFTIIPNFILNHSTAVAQALYLQLKRLAGDNGLAFPGSRYLMDKLGVSYPTLKKEFKYLLDKGWIKDVGERSIQTDGGRQKVRAYKVVDLWQLNAEYYATQGGEKIATPCPRGAKIATQGVKSGGEKIATKEDPCIKSLNTQEEESSFLKNKKKPFYQNMPMWKRPADGKWFVIAGPGDFRDFGDKESTIIWK